MRAERAREARRADGLRPRSPGQGLTATWRRWESNPRPPACKAGALPTELRPRGATHRTAAGGVGDSAGRMVRMTVERMDNVGIVVEDLDAAIAFFVELGLELEGRMVVEGAWVDGVLGLTDARSEIAMLRTPDGHSRLELAMYHHPAAGRTEPAVLPPNTLGLHR